MAKILLIDDDEGLRPMLARCLKKHGHEVAEAANGEEGLAVIARNPVELVITDLVMPEKEGVETIRFLRANHPTVRVIAISGLSGRTDFYLKLAAKFGADLTLAKPFSLEKFENAVARMLAKPTELG
jgi:DNA-binding response OmpR family regulator